MARITEVPFDSVLRNVAENRKKANKAFLCKASAKHTDNTTVRFDPITVTEYLLGVDSSKAE